MNNTDPAQRRVLLFEDDEDIRDLMRRLLASYGCTAVLASTREQLDEHLAAGPVALALLDIMLPGEDGREVARILHEAGQSFPCYFMTGLQNTVTEADLAFVDGVLYKPFTVNDLRAILDKTVGRPEKPPTLNNQHALELMTAIATEQEALGRQEERMRAVIESLPSAQLSAETVQQLEQLTRQYKDGLNQLSELLGTMRSKLQP